jgi:hypothetical protein
MISRLTVSLKLEYLESCSHQLGGYLAITSTTCSTQARKRHNLNTDIVHRSKKLYERNRWASAARPLASVSFIRESRLLCLFVYN